MDTVSFFFSMKRNCHTCIKKIILVAVVIYPEPSTCPSIETNKLQEVECFAL